MTGSTYRVDNSVQLAVGIHVGMSARSTQSLIVGGNHRITLRKPGVERPHGSRMIVIGRAVLIHAGKSADIGHTCGAVGPGQYRPADFGWLALGYQHIARHHNGLTPGAQAAIADQQLLAGMFRCRRQARRLHGQQCSRLGSGNRYLRRDCLLRSLCLCCQWQSQT